MKSALPQQTDITQRKARSEKVPQIRKSPRFSTARQDEPGNTDDRIHDGSGGHQPGTARAGSLEPRQIASHSGPDTKSSPSTAARLRLFGCRTSPARTTGIAVENTRRMQITVQPMRTWLPRAAPHIAGPIHFSAQLFQHINGLSPTSQFSPSGGAGRNAPTRGAEMPTRPSIFMTGGGGGARIGVLCEVPRVTWLVRAIAGVASTAAAISAADRSLGLVI